MPKRVGYLYQWMCDKQHIHEAIHAGAKRKQHRTDVAKVLANEDQYVDAVYDLLVTHSFVPQQPRHAQRYDTSSRKWREIEYVKFFPDGIIHTLMVMAMEPVIMRGMYRWSCASVPDRGSSAARKYCQRAIKNDRKGTKYIFKLDIHHYYHSVNRRVLLRLLARKIKDKDFLRLVWDILNTCQEGLGIGFFICQWLANFYLETLDRFILTLPGVKYMVRYMDDIVIMGPNKRQLHRARVAIADFMRRLRLEMKDNWQIFPLRSRPLDFVGYKFYRDHTTLRRRNFLNLTRQARRLQKRIAAGYEISFHQAASLLSRVGMLVHCDGMNVRKKYIDPIGIKRLKEVVRNESKRRSQSWFLQLGAPA